jgi:hypothetical protein
MGQQRIENAISPSIPSHKDHSHCRRRHTTPHSRIGRAPYHAADFIFVLLLCIKAHPDCSIRAVIVIVIVCGYYRGYKFAKRPLRARPERAYGYIHSVT